MRAGHHLQDEEIERYSMESVAEDEIAHFEEHLLVCESCRQRVSECDGYVLAMRTAAVELQRQPEPARQLLLLRTRAASVAAAAVLLIAVAVVGTRMNGRGPATPPIAVALKATRGAALPTTAPPDRPLGLKLDLEGVPEHSSYAISAVDGSGNVIWRGVAQTKDSQASATLPATRTGTYFIRLYAPSGDLLREYGLVISDR